MKRGIILFFILYFICISAHCVSAYDGYGYFGATGFPSVSELAQNEWVNAALLFLLIFAFCWFVLQNVFRAQKGAGIVISLIMAAIGALGVVYFYGPIISKVGHWLLFLILAVIGFLLFIQFRAQGNVAFFILLALSLLWLFFGHRMLCPPLGAPFPHELCILLDTIAAILIIIGIIKLLAWIFGRISGHISIGGGGGGDGGGDNHYTLTIGVQGYGTTNPAPGNYRKKENSKITVRAIPRNNAKFDHWELDGVNLGANPKVTITMDSDHTLYAIFSGASPHINIKIVVEGPGTTIPSPGIHSYPINTTVNLTAIPAKNATFKEWRIQYVKGTCKSRSFNLNLKSPVFAGKNLINIIAVFEGEAPPIKVYIEANPKRIGEGGVTTINWHANNADWVEITPFIIGKKAPQGSQKVKLYKSTTFTAIAGNNKGQRAKASCYVEVLKAITHEEKKMLPPPAEIDIIKRNLNRIQNLLDKEMKKGDKANRARIDKLLEMRDKLKKRLREIRK